MENYNISSVSFCLFALRLAFTDIRSFSACTAVQFFPSVSTVIDVATHRPNPTPFGTQHVALLLAAWVQLLSLVCFVLYFYSIHEFHYLSGHLPSVVRNLMPWRELRKWLITICTKYTIRSPLPFDLSIKSGILHWSLKDVYATSRFSYRSWYPRRLTKLSRSCAVATASTNLRFWSVTVDFVCQWSIWTVNNKVRYLKQRCWSWESFLVQITAKAA